MDAELANTTLNSTVQQTSHALHKADSKLKVANAAVTTLEAQAEVAATALGDSQKECKSAQEQLAAAKKRIEVLEATLRVSEDRHLVNSSMCFNHSSFAFISLYLYLSMQSTLVERDGFSSSLSLREADLGIANQKSALLEGELNSLQAKLADLMRRMGQDSDNTKKALEKAISASVRLCVVAPTVNVHVSDKKLKFKAG